MPQKILVVGCGGLGCELLKLLALESNIDLTVIDNDTVDATNLNRQFFFTKKDVNFPKSEVAAKKVQKIFENRIEKEEVGIKRQQQAENSIKYIYSKIDEISTIDFYKQFDVVYNCLDNDKTRLYVNQRCNLLKIRMIDGGSAGWNGQSFVNQKECFDCRPKKREKVYPVCSIRQKPENFEHCAIWAKNVYEDNDIESLMQEIEENLVKGDCFDISEDKFSSPADQKNSFESDSKNELSKESEVEYSKESEIEIFNDGDENSHSSDRNDIQDFKDSEFERIPVIDLKSIKSITEISSLGEKNFVVYRLACFKANRFAIKPFSFIKFETFLNKIIPSICTTNSIIASLMILSNKNNKNYYYSDRIISVEPTEKSEDCLTCSIPNYICNFRDQMKISDFLEKFNGDSVLTSEMVYDRFSDVPLLTIDREFCLVVKNTKNNLIYFEVGDVYSMKRCC